MSNLSTELAGRIVDRLIREELLAAGGRDKLLSKIVSGTMSKDDWILLEGIRGSGRANEPHPHKPDN